MKQLVPGRNTVSRLAETLQEAVDLLDGARDWIGPSTEPPEATSSLIQQCVELAQARHRLDNEAIRTVHHFACTGGTLISKCIASLANVQLLSEFDPLSTMARKGPRPNFAPTDMMVQLLQGTRAVEQEVLVKMARAQLRVAYEATLSKGNYLVIRDHTHSHFCTGAGIHHRPTVRELVQEVAPTLSLVTVRDPLDSYTSLRKNGWVGFEPATLDEYCRRYLAFLDRYGGVPTVRYEDFVHEPERCMRLICRHLALPYFDQFASVFSVFDLTGESGRRFAKIQVPEPRPEREALTEEAEASESCRELVHRLGYPFDPNE